MVSVRALATKLIPFATRVAKFRLLALLIIANTVACQAMSGSIHPSIDPLVRNLALPRRIAILRVSGLAITDFSVAKLPVAKPIVPLIVPGAMLYAFNDAGFVVVTIIVCDVPTYTRLKVIVPRRVSRRVVMPGIRVACAS